jgi:hypothetical protein
MSLSDVAVVEVDGPGYSKLVTKIKTPKVRRVRGGMCVRVAFREESRRGCPHVWCRGCAARLNARKAYAHFPM